MSLLQGSFNDFGLMLLHLLRNETTHFPEKVKGFLCTELALTLSPKFKHCRFQIILLELHKTCYKFNRHILHETVVTHY